MTTNHFDLIDAINADVDKLEAKRPELGSGIELLRLKLEIADVSTAELEHIRGSIAAMLND